jgi:spore coat protein H
VVTINGKRRGLYYLKEGYDKHFRQRHFKSHTGNLYDGGFLRDIDQALQRLSGKGPAKHEDLKAVVKACGLRDKDKRFEALAKLIDMDRFISFLCVEMITCDWDGYPRNRNNYRIYGDPKTKKLVFFPSGLDQMFNDVNLTIFPDCQGVLAKAVMETKEGRKRYLARLDELLKKALKADDLAKKLQAAAKPVAAALKDTDKNLARDMPTHAKNVAATIKQRLASVEKQLKAELAKDKKKK